MVLDILDSDNVPLEMLEPSEAVDFDAKDEDEEKREKVKEDEERTTQDSGQPVVADFRFGPAQLWWVKLMVSSMFGDKCEWKHKITDGAKYAQQNNRRFMLKLFWPLTGTICLG